MDFMRLSRFKSNSRVTHGSEKMKELLSRPKSTLARNIYGPARQKLTKTGSTNKGQQN